MRANAQACRDGAVKWQCAAIKNDYKNRKPCARRDDGTEEPG